MRPGSFSPSLRSSVAEQEPAPLFFPAPPMVTIIIDDDAADHHDDDADDHHPYHHLNHHHHLSHRHHLIKVIQEKQSPRTRRTKLTQLVCR